ncbi:MAG: FGGY family carbohydrate kinase [Kiritimatiellae bacterium]|nr:FGGY family carbohydrate kinase [Kiritimatiellia bacterium]
MLHVAIDLGASNGRVLLGSWTGRPLRVNHSGLEVAEAHRFANAPVFERGHWRWDWPYLRSEFRLGLRKAAEMAGQERIVSVGCCSWAQDFAMLDAAGAMLENPVCYRDEFTRGLPQAFAGVISPENLVKRVGCCISPITALCKLKAMRDRYPELLRKTKTILHMADMVHFDLCGRAATDWSLAAAGQMFNIARQEWDLDLLERLGIPSGILPPVTEKPSVIGKISPERSPHPALNNVKIVSTIHHDTACATAVLRPIAAGTFFISLGSYAMPGCVLRGEKWPKNADPGKHALIGIADRRRALFAGCAGMWIIQECRRLWQQEGRQVDYEHLARLAGESGCHGVIDLNAPRFSKPENMVAEIKKACREGGGDEPVEVADISKIVFDSLAEGFVRGIRGLEKAGQMPCKKLFLIGGGSRNRYLVRQIGERLGREVVAGPAEAAAAGSLMLQREVLNSQ